MPAEFVGRFEVLRPLGEGGMGRVLLARDPGTGAVVALKLLHPALCPDPGARTRFFREAYAAHSLRSEHIVRVFEVGALPDGTPFQVMEYLEGQDLGQLIEARGPLPWGEAVGYVAQACAGLSEAHHAGIVHRDIKPANLLLVWRSGAPLVKVLDFGVVRAASAGATLTHGQHLVGSPRTMAPEQMDGAGTVTPSADVWALGVLLYRMLEGVYPFEGESLAELLVNIATRPPRPPARADLPPQLLAIMARCLRVDPAERYQEAGQLLLALGPLLPRWASPPDDSPTLDHTPGAPVGVAPLAGAELAVADGKPWRMALWQKLTLGAAGAVALGGSLLVALVAVVLYMRAESLPVEGRAELALPLEIPHPERTNILESMPRIEAAIRPHFAGPRLLALKVVLFPPGHVDLVRSMSWLTLSTAAGECLMANLSDRKILLKRYRLAPVTSMMPLPPAVRCSMADAARVAYRSGIREAPATAALYVEPASKRPVWQIEQDGVTVLLDASTCARLP